MQRALSAAAERNKQPIADQLALLLPVGAQVLEIASGSGQHVQHFARLLPGRSWQPSERLAADVATLAQHCAADRDHGILEPARLDVLDAAWPVTHNFDAVLCINMIHISPWEATPALFAGASRHLAARGAGLVVLYGPFRRDGRHTAPSNEQFDAWLHGLDPRFGVRDLETVEDVARAQGLVRECLVQMPANNLLVAWRRS